MSHKRGRIKVPSLLETMIICLKQKNQISSMRKVTNHIREVIMIMTRVLKRLTKKLIILT